MQAPRRTPRAAAAGTLIALWCSVTAAQGHLGADAPAAPAAQAAQAAQAAPPGGLARWLDPANAPFIPIPEIDTGPQTGTTLGLIPTTLRINDHSEIERITAPDIIYSQYFGWGARMRIFAYPSEDTQWSLVGGGKERVEREFDGRYLAGQTRTGTLSWSVEALYDRSGTPRFFGLGNDSRYANQTTYVDNQVVVAASLGLNFTPALQLAYEVRERDVDVLPGVLAGIPSIEERFPGLPGIGHEQALENGVVLTRDTRDAPVVPQRGTRLLVYGGFVSRALGSSVAYTYFGAEAHVYWPLGPGVTLAWHAALRYMPSAAEAPFWALSSLGGDRSVTDEREPLRSEGADRYVDRNLFASGAELRARVAGFNAFGTRVSLELAPFVDSGKVFSSYGTSPFTHLHAAAGLGVRAVASPFVVGYVDIGYGHGRSAVFSGINYPF
jgi:hypothetical protein